MHFGKNPALNGNRDVMHILGIQHGSIRVTSKKADWIQIWGDCCKVAGGTSAAYFLPGAASAGP